MALGYEPTRRPRWACCLRVERLRPGRACERTRGVVRVASALAASGLPPATKGSRIDQERPCYPLSVTKHDRYCVCGTCSKGPCRRAATCMITSGASATISAASRKVGIVRPKNRTIDFECCGPRSNGIPSSLCANAEMRACASASS